MFSIKGKTTRDLPPLADGLVPVKNGIFDLNSNALMDFDPQNFIINEPFNCCYDPTAECTLFDKTLKEILPEQSDRTVFQEFCGYLLFNNCSLGKALMLIGYGANGKSTLLRIIMELINPSNISTLTLQELSNNRFAAAQLFGKIGNMNHELPKGALKDTSVFKNLVTGELITAEEKFKTPFQFPNVAKQIYACNNPPRSPDLSDGFFRRWIFIVFPQKFSADDPNTDPYIADKIIGSKSEMAGIFNWMLKGYSRLIKYGKFSTNKTTRDMRNYYIMLSDPARAFADAYLRSKIGAKLSFNEIHKKYQSFCKKHKLPVVSKTMLGKTIKDVFGCCSESVRIKDKVSKVYMNLAFINEDEIENTSDQVIYEEKTAIQEVLM